MDKIQLENYSVEKILVNRYFKIGSLHIHHVSKEKH